MGPKKIGEGSYGCVYKPALSCKNGQPIGDGYISKLLTKVEAIQEASVMNVIDKMDPDGIFHYPLVNKCKTKFQPRRCANCHDEDCKSTCCDVGNTTDILIYEDGGLSLQNAMTTPLNAKNYFIGIWRLFFGLTVMHYNEFYHLDIKPDNIMVQETAAETIVKFIDFGIAMTKSDATITLQTSKLDSLFERYIYHPPDAVS